MQATYRVVLESLDAGYDPVAWRRCALVGLAGLIDADFNIAATMPATPRPGEKSVSLAIFHGTRDDSHARWLRFARDGDLSKDPLTEPVMRKWGEPLTARLEELMDYAKWRRTQHARDVYLANGVYDFMHSRVPRADLGQVSVLTFTRGKGQRRFTERERRMVEIAHAELAARIATPRESLDGLPTRLQELATHLRGPMSEKEIAREMRLSRHTVHNYMRSLYRRLGVATRSEAAHVLKARDGRSSERNELVLA